MTSIPSNEYHILSYHHAVASSPTTPVPGKRRRCLRSGFPPANMRCNGDAMLQHPHWCNARHVICLRCATDERKGPGLVESEENGAAGRFVTASPQQTEPGAFARPVSFLTSCKHKTSTVGNETSSTKCLKCCKSGFLMVSYGFPKKNEALCVTGWFGKFLLRHIHFSRHKIPKPLQWPPQKRVALSPHADIVP